MKKFEDYNPIAVFLYYLFVSIPVMFSQNPVILITGLVFGIVFYCFKNREQSYKGAWMLLLPFVGMLINPLFNHSGTTYLFFINNNPITMESALFGLNSGIMITATLIWFSTFTLIFTSDKLLYVLGAVSPKLALILSMTLRYIPLFKKQIRKTNDAQKAMGIYKDNTLFDKISGGLRVFSVMVTWALENGVITADSMTARGYGVGKRSRFAIFKWNMKDSIIAASSAVSFAITLGCMLLGKLSCIWYPTIKLPGINALSIAAYISYTILALIPSYLQIKEETRWKSLISKI